MELVEVPEVLVRVDDRHGRRRGGILGRLAIRPRSKGPASLSPGRLARATEELSAIECHFRFLGQAAWSEVPIIARSGARASKKFGVAGRKCLSKINRGIVAQPPRLLGRRDACTTTHTREQDLPPHHPGAAAAGWTLAASASR